MSFIKNVETLQNVVKYNIEGRIKFGGAIMSRERFKKRYKNYLVYGGLFGLFLVLVISQGNSSKKEEALYNHPALDIQSYQFPLEGQLIDRIEKPNDIIMDYLMQYDKQEGLYEPYYPTHKEFEIIKESFDELPRSLKEVALDRVAGIYFVKNFLGSGFTEFFRDKNGETYTFLVFNPELFDQTASQKLGYRETSNFKEEEGYELIYDLGEVNSFVFLLHHEMMHVYDGVKEVTPGDPYFTRVEEDTKNYPFTRDIWESFSTPYEKYDFEKRGLLHFYGIGGVPEIVISESPDIYRHLEDSPFVSLYGAMNYMEDFAEIGAIYLHIVKYNRPYKITLLKDGQEVYTFSNPLNRDVVQSRVKRLESMFE